LSQIGYPSDRQANPFRYFFIGIPFVGKEQRLIPFAFFGSVFPPFDDILKKMFFILCQSYPVYLL
jgi:hypothetical protein